MSTRARVDLPLPSGEYRSSIWLLNTNDSSGVLVGLDSVRVPLPNATVQMSDLVLGSADGAATWGSGEGVVHFNPRKAPSGAGAMSKLSTSVSGSHSRHDVPDAIRFLPATAIRESKIPQLSITLPATGTTGLNAVRRTIGVKSLNPGHYRVRVTITGSAATATSSGCLTIVP